MQCLAVLGGVAPSGALGCPLYGVDNIRSDAATVLPERGNIVADGVLSKCTYITINSIIPIITCYYFYTWVCL